MADRDQIKEGELLGKMLAIPPQKHKPVS